MSAIEATNDVATLYGALEYRLRCFAIRILQERPGGESHAQDVVHEAFAWMLREINRGGRWPSAGAATGSLYRATRNYALQALVSNGLMIQSRVKTARAMPAAFLDDVNHPKRIDECENAEQRASLVKALGKLPRRERDVYLRCEFRGDSHSEVADELGMRTPQVGLTLYKARNRLAWHLEHGDRPYYANGSCGLRKTLVRDAHTSQEEAKRLRLKQNRQTYARRQFRDTVEIAT